MKLPRALLTVIKPFMCGDLEDANGAGGGGGGNW